MMKGLYIHIPFCKSKCNYCGFYSICNFDTDILEKYLNRVIQVFLSFHMCDFSTIYIGGGTPSVISARLFDNFLKKLSKAVNFHDLQEFTVEVNPESVNIDLIQVFKNYNVNRISLGAQSFDNNVLRLLGRVHDSDLIISSVELIRKYHKMAALNLDIIYDIPLVPYSAIENSLQSAIKLSCEHISAYTYSFDTEFFKGYTPIDESMYLRVKHFLEEKGYRKYEISNFAKTGFESIHNKKYWQMKEYLGVGASASSMIIRDGKRVRFTFSKNVNEFILNPYLTDLEIVCNKDELLKEDIVFGLRMLDGVDLKSLRKSYGKLLNNFLEKSSALFEENLIRMSGERLCLTESGELLLDSVQQFFWEL